VNNDPGFYVGSPKEELGKGKGKAPIEHSEVPPRLQSLGDLIIHSPESTLDTASSSPESTPATASSSHLLGEGCLLTREEKKTLEIALGYKQQISNLLRTIIIDKGENFTEETNPNLAEVALDWEDCWDPKQLLSRIKSFEFHKGQSSFYKRTEDWVKAERQFRRGQ
jgi:hypothetical protein